MLHPFDDYPLHQTPEPLLHLDSPSPDAYDRFFYNGYRADGSVFFALALGLYPNRQVIDGAFSVVRHGVQHNIRASGRCPEDRTATRVGPVRVVIDEPMRRHRLLVDDRFGLSADLAWTTIAPAIEEPRFSLMADHRRLFDYTRLTQFGRWEGWIDLDGERITIGGPDPVTGCRDRSWGVRPVGDRLPGPVAAPQFFWIWAPTVFDDACTHVAINHHGDGRPWHQSGAVVPRIGPDEPALDPGRVQRGTAARTDITWDPGTRWARSLTTTLERWEADPVVVSYEPFLRFQMSGVGYRHPEWGHGRWRGDDEATRDAQDLATVDPGDPVNVHIQALSRARWGNRVGVGVVEQLVIGPHAPTGLTGVVEGAPLQP